MKVDTPWVAMGPRVYFPRTTDGFDLNGCPDATNKAAFLVVAVNHHAKMRELITALLWHMPVVHRGSKLVQETKQLLSDLDNFARWYAAAPVTRDELKSGDKVIVDAGFTCMTPWSIREVKVDGVGQYLECNKGRHYLDAQVNFDDPILIGVRKVTDGQV